MTKIICGKTLVCKSDDFFFLKNMLTICLQQDVTVFDGALIFERCYNMVMSSVLVECNIATQSVFVLGSMFFALLNLNCKQHLHVRVPFVESVHSLYFACISICRMKRKVTTKCLKKKRKTSIMM